MCPYLIYSYVYGRSRVLIAVGYSDIEISTCRFHLALLPQLTVLRGYGINIEFWKSLVRTLGPATFIETFHDFLSRHLRWLNPWSFFSICFQITIGTHISVLITLPYQKCMMFLSMTCALCVIWCLISATTHVAKPGLREDYTISDARPLNLSSGYSLARRAWCAGGLSWERELLLVWSANDCLCSHGPELWIE